MTTPILRYCRRHCATLALAVGLLAGVDRAQAAESSLRADYASQGELIVTHLASAPFPHPARAEGHRYQDKLFTAAENYSDDTVAIFIPRNFRETGTIDFVIHFHGWGNNVSNVLAQYHLVDQLMASGRNAILVVPQGPRNASDSFGGKLEDPDGFKRFMADVGTTLRQKSQLARKDFKPGRVVLSGHSGGYQVISSIVERGGLSNQIREVWLFDALYSRGEKFLAWWGQQHGRLLNIYTDNGGTLKRSEEMMAQLKQQGTQFQAGEEGAFPAADLKADQPIFLHTKLGHNEVVAAHQTFKLFLETSCLEARTAPGDKPAAR